MKKNANLLLLSLLLSICCANFAYAEALNPVSAEPTANVSSQISSASISPIVEVNNKTTSAQVPPVLVAPVVQDPKRLLKPTNRKVDLHAILFDPAVTVAAPPNAVEMSQTEVAKYKIDEALHGQVSAVSTKGLLEDTMKMTFEKGFVENISPWIDYQGCFQNIWAGENYKNSLYGVNFNDFGINGKFRTNDDPASGKKTVFRIMFNTGKEITGNTYLQSFLADNYIMRYWSKDDQILIGNSRTPIGLEGGESPYTIPFFSRSQLSRTYGNVRSIGLKAQGNHKLYDYNLGFYSSGRFFRDFFPGPEFAGMLSVKPLGLTDGKYGKLTAGGSLNAGNSESSFVVGGAHLMYEYKRLKATAEYATADGSNGSIGYTPNASEGFYGTLAYRLTPRLQAVVRYDQFDANKNKANDIRTEYTAGLNYFIKGQALKLMLNFVYYTVENGTYGSRIMTGTQIIL